MHADFPQDPATVTVVTLSLLVGIFGWLGGGFLWAAILFAMALVPLLLVEWVAYAVYEHLIVPRRQREPTRASREG